MDLIYADIINGLVVDRGVLTNYSYDMSYGADDNDFQLILPIKGTRLKEDQLVYIPGTEYGGIIDSIKVDTATQMLTYSGRTWHGILESKILYPETGKDYMYVCGEANSVLATLLERMNIIPGELNELMVAPEYPIIKVSQEDSGIYVDAKITSESGNYAHGYSFIRDLLYASDAKPLIIDGVLSAVPLNDYSNNDDFLEGTDQFQAKYNYNGINRMHCLGEGNLRNRYTIDLYWTENGVLLPYSKENPIKDSDYYTDIPALAHSYDVEDLVNYDTIKENMVTGAKEIADIYDYPNASVTYHYVLQDRQPSDWEEDLTPEIVDVTDKNKRYGFMQYYAQPDEGGEFKSIEKPAIDYHYNLQYEMPKDWKSNFADYYKNTANGYEKVTPVTSYKPVNTMPSGWYEGSYSNYFRLSNGNYVKVSLIPGLIPLTNVADWETTYMNYCNADGSKVKGVKPDAVYTKLTSKKAPEDWAKNHTNYYYWDGNRYQKVRSESVTKYRKLKSKPSNWNSSYKNYYIKVGGKWEHCTSKSQWDINKVRESYSVPKAPAYKKNYYFSMYQPPDVAPPFVAGQYFSSGKVVPAWGSFQAYEKQTVPAWATNTYYTKEPYQPIPNWTETTYTRYEDHYQSLIEGALKRFNDNYVQSELSIKLDEFNTYDINDRIGASDEVTGIGAVERITQKVVKIQRGVVSFNYNTGK